MDLAESRRVTWPRLRLRQRKFCRSRKARHVGGFTGRDSVGLLGFAFKDYLYGGDVPGILVFTDDLRAQIHMFGQAALEEAVVHHFGHVHGCADGSSASL